MKRNIITTVLLACAAALTTQAQEVLLVRMKDGTTARFSNGIDAGTVRFWGAPEGKDLPQLAPTDFAEASAGEQPALGTDWHVADYCHRGGQYAVAIAWRSSLMPASAKYAVCVGSEPGVNVENADTVFGLETTGRRWEFGQADDMTPSLQALLPGQGEVNYLLLGQRDQYGSWHGTYIDLEEDNGPQERCWADCPLLHGKTYYYRVATQVTGRPNAEQAQRGAEEQHWYFYGPEQHFRVPNLAGDDGYEAGGIYFSSDAWKKFCEHFPEGQTLPEHVIATLRAQWEAALETSPYDLAKATDITYDDGVVHLLPEVPEAFWTWMSTREIIVGAEQKEMYGSQLTANNMTGEFFPDTEFQVVANADPAWNFPGNSYLLASPLSYDWQKTPNLNPALLFDLSQAVPGVRYRLTVTFAPETRFTPDAEGNYAPADSVHLLPTYVQMTAFTPSTPNISSAVVTPWGYATRAFNLQNPNPLAEETTSRFIVSATEPRVVEMGEVNLVGTYLKIYSNASNLSIRTGRYNNELRVAEVRLTPITGE